MSFQLPEPGQSFQGRYVVEKHIGSGGFAEVYRAVDQNGRKVAIKLLVPGQQEWAATDKLITRFEREGELLGRLTNEHTVQMVEQGRTAENLPFIVFEFIEGMDLAEMIDTYGALPPKRVVTILQQVCSALKEAHDLGVMHRDIKPANIMIYQHLGIQGLAKLLDFGIAKPTDEGDSNASGSALTTAGMVLGTPRYMAPEQFTGSRAHPTSDIYSLGLVAYELLTGESAVDAESNSGIFRQQLSKEEFKIPKTANIPPRLKRVVEKMITKDRNKRYQSVAELIIDLEALGDLDKKNNKPDIIQIAAMVAVLLLVVVAGWRFLGGGEPDPPPPPPPKPAVDKDPKSVYPTAKETPPATNQAPQTTGQDEIRVEPIADPNPPRVEKKAELELPERDPPPDDGIAVLKLASMAEAKPVASSAYTNNEWDKVIGACKPFAKTEPFCTRLLAESYKNKGDATRACYWFEVLKDDRHGLDCP